MKPIECLNTQETLAYTSFNDIPLFSKFLSSTFLYRVRHSNVHKNSSYYSLVKRTCTKLTQHICDTIPHIIMSVFLRSRKKSSSLYCSALVYQRKKIFDRPRWNQQSTRTSQNWANCSTTLVQKNWCSDTINASICMAITSKNELNVQNKIY